MTLWGDEKEFIIYINSQGCAMTSLKGHKYWGGLILKTGTEDEIWKAFFDKNYEIPSLRAPQTTNQRPTS